MSGWNRKLTLCALLGALLALGACSRREPAATSARDAILRLSQRNEPATLDPLRATLPDEFFVIRALGEGLLAPNPDGGAPLPGAAARWEASPDGLTYTFHLRPGATWSNGAPVTAHDFAWWIKRALDPATAAPKAGLFFGLKHARAFYDDPSRGFDRVGVRALDDRTLQLELAQPNPDFPAIVASGPWIPVQRSTVERLGVSPANAEGYVGNGPFTLVEWKPNQHLLVRRNPRYHAASRVQLEGVRFQVYDSGDTEERAFRAGQVDVTMGVPFTKLATYAPPTLRTQPLAETRYLSLNVTRPPLADARVRRALALALDRRVLIDAVLKGGQQPALSFIPPGLGGYQPEETLRGDAAEARRLLAEAGFPAGRGFPALEIATWTNPQLIEVVQQMWRQELGIETAIVQREARVHLAGLAAGDYAIALVPTLPDYDSAAALLGGLTGTSAENYPRWHQPRFDALVAEAGATLDPARRLARLREAEALLLAELPVVPLYFNTQNYLLSPRVLRWRQDGLWNRYYLDVSLNQ